MKPNMPFAWVSLTALLLAGLPLAARAADADYSPLAQPAKSLAELRQELETQLKDAGRFIRLTPYKGFSMINYDSVKSLRVGPEGVAIEFGSAQGFGAGGAADLFNYHFFYEDLATLRFDGETCHPKAAPLPDGMEVRFAQPVARKLCDTLFTLGQRTVKQAEKDQALFAEQAARYRSQAVKPALTEELRRLIVQAESARQRKDYAGAAELFRIAIRLDPVAYPAAYFNLALLYEQQAYYARAIDAMRNYLTLQPNAADTRSAQDKIYSWEVLAPQK